MLSDLKSVQEKHSGEHDKRSSQLQYLRCVMNAQTFENLSLKNFDAKVPKSEKCLIKIIKS